MQEKSGGGRVESQAQRNKQDYGCELQDLHLWTAV